MINWPSHDSVATLNRELEQSLKQLQWKVEERVARRLALRPTPLGTVAFNPEPVAPQRGEQPDGESSDQATTEPIAVDLGSPGVTGSGDPSSTPIRPPAQAQVEPIAVDLGSPAVTGRGGSSSTPIRPPGIAPSDLSAEGFALKIVFARIITILGKLKDTFKRVFNKILRSFRT